MGDRYTEPQFNAAALVTIDTQCDVLDGGAFPIPGTSAALPSMRRLADAFREAEQPIVHVVRIYEPDGSNAESARRELIQAGAGVLLRAKPGVQLAPELLPRPDLKLDDDRLLAGDAQALGPHEVAIFKPRWGAFYKTPLEQHLREHGITTLVFAGANFPNCPRTSIYEASERDFRIVLARDAVSGLYERSERELASIGVTLLTTDEITAAVNPSAGDDDAQPHDRQRHEEDRRVEDVPFGASHVRADQHAYDHD